LVPPIIVVSKPAAGGDGKDDTGSARLQSQNTSRSISPVRPGLSTLPEEMGKASDESSERGSDASPVASRGSNQRSPLLKYGLAGVPMSRRIYPGKGPKLGPQGGKMGTSANYEHATTFIFEYKKKKVPNMRRPLFPAPGLLKIMSQLYVDKIKAGKGVAVHTSHYPLYLILYELFLNKFGLRKVAENKLVQVTPLILLMRQF
jgi:hypothetical protein